MKTILIFLLTSLNISILFAQATSNTSIDLQTLVLNKNKLLSINEIPLKGSNVDGIYNLGSILKISKQFKLKKFLAINLSTEYGKGYVGFKYLSTYDFNSSNIKDSPYSKIYDNISSDIIEFVGIGFGLLYEKQIKERNVISLSLAPKINYYSRTSASLTSGVQDSSNNYEKLFESSIIINNDKQIKFLLSSELNYIHIFKNKKIGIKSGIVGGILISKPFISGEIKMHGTDSTYLASIKGNYSYYGINVGLIYYCD